MFGQQGHSWPTVLDHDTSLTALASCLDCNYSGVSSGGPLVFLDDCRSLCDVATIFLAQYFQCSANDEEYDLHAKEHNGAFKSPLRRRVLRKDKTPPEGKQPATEKKKDGEESPKDRHKANPNDRRKTTEVPDTVPGPHSRSGVTDIQNAENLDQRRSMRAGFVQGTVSCLGCGSVRHMLRLCPHVNDDDRTKIWAKWQDKLATHRQLLKKYKKGSPTADKEKYDELSKTYSKSLDKAFVPRCA